MFKYILTIISCFVFVGSADAQLSDLAVSSAVRGGAGGGAVVAGKALAEGAQKIKDNAQITVIMTIDLKTGEKIQVAPDNSAYIVGANGKRTRAKDGQYIDRSGSPVYVRNGNIIN